MFLQPGLPQGRGRLAFRNLMKNDILIKLMVWLELLRWLRLVFRERISCHFLFIFKRQETLEAGWKIFRKNFHKNDASKFVEAGSQTCTLLSFQCAILFFATAKATRIIISIVFNLSFPNGIKSVKVHFNKNLLVLHLSFPCS